MTRNRFAKPSCVVSAVGLACLVLFVSSIAAADKKSAGAKATVEHVFHTQPRDDKAAAAKRDLHLAIAELPLRFWDNASFATADPAETITCLRSVLMKPEHLEWLESIWERLLEAYSETRF